MLLLFLGFGALFLGDGAETIGLGLKLIGFAVIGAGVVLVLLDQFNGLAVGVVFVCDFIHRGAFHVG